MDRVRFLAGLAIAFAVSAIAGPPTLPPVKEWKDSGRQVVLAAPVRIAIGAENPADRDLGGRAGVERYEGRVGVLAVAIALPDPVPPLA